jgi:DNA-binding NarL/FixJ family response regulator
MTALTSRETHVLTLLGNGVKVDNIARILNITVNTCRSYVKSIHVKLEVHSQLEAVVKAQRLGLIAGSEDR